MTRGMIAYDTDVNRQMQYSEETGFLDIMYIIAEHIHILN